MADGLGMAAQRFCRILFMKCQGSHPRFGRSRHFKGCKIRHVGELFRKVSIPVTVTVVDSFQFSKDFSCGENLKCSPCSDRKMATGSDDDRTLSDLLVDQVKSK
eukprot:759276-Hanusia_phi.AAC.3